MSKEEEVWENERGRKQVDRDIKDPVSSLITPPEKTASYVPAYLH